MKIKVFTLGCRLNQYELQSIITQLKTKGHEVFNHKTDTIPDLTIINTCIVTGKSETKSRNLINRAKLKSKKVIVAGCYAKKIKKEGEIVYLSNDYKSLIPQIVDNWNLLDQIDTLNTSRFKYTPPVKATTTRVNLKIQDGCDNFCSYCIVPLVRGNPISKPLSDIVDEFKILINNGFKEVVITGVSIGKYTYNQINLSKLLSTLLHIDGHFRLHLSSIDPNDVNEELIALFHSKKMVKHLHLSLQSGSNKILKQMNRKYSREDYLLKVKQIKDVYPHFNFSTDLIVGFPGESEKDHQDSITLIKEVGFSHVHTFKFSPRPLTKAFDMPDKIKEPIKKNRSEKIINLAENYKTKYYEMFHHQISEVLIEKSNENGSYGLNQYYIPIEIIGKQPKNEIIKVKLNYHEKLKKLIGEPIN